jgi:hypothetical protein
MGARSVEVNKGLVAVGCGIGTLFLNTTRKRRARMALGTNSPSPVKNSYLSSFCGDSLETDKKRGRLTGGSDSAWNSQIFLSFSFGGAERDRTADLVNAIRIN